MKMCLFCGSTEFDNDNICCLCHRNNEDGRLVGLKAVGYRRRNLRYPIFLKQGLLLIVSAVLMAVASLAAASMAELIWIGAVGLVCAALMAFVGVKRLLIRKKAREAYFEIVSATDQKDSKTIPLNHYETYERSASDQSFWLLLLPILVFAMMLIFFYYASSHTHVILFGIFSVTLPSVNSSAYGLLCLVLVPGLLLSVIDLLVSFVSMIILKVSRVKAAALNKYCVVVYTEPDEQHVSIVPAPAESPDQSAENDRPDTASAPVTEPSVLRYTDSYDPIYADGRTPAKAPTERTAAEGLSLDPLFEIDRKYRPLPEKPCKDMSLPELCQRLSRSLKDCGLDMTADEVAAVVAALGAYRLISLNGSEDARVALASALSQCFDTPLFTETAQSTWQTEEDMLFEALGAATVPSAYLKGLYTAHYTPAHLCLTLLEKADVAALCSMMKEFGAYAKAPLKKHSLCISNGYTKALPEKLCSRAKDDDYTRSVMLELPLNARCLLSPTGAQGASVPTAALQNGSAWTLIIGGKRTKTTPKTGDTTPIAYPCFAELIKNAETHRYLAEEQWKKIDALELFLRERVGFALDNRLLRKLETYTSVFLACGGSVDAALDHMLEGVLSSVLNGAEPAALTARDGKTGLSEMLDKTFGADNIPCCHRLLRRLGLEN